MDPLSIAASALSVASGIGSAIITVHSFFKVVREAKHDLEAVSHELSSVKTVLELIDYDCNTGVWNNLGIQKQLQDQLLANIEKCGVVAQEIDDLLKKYLTDSKRRRIQWAIEGRRDMEKCCSRLEGHKSAIDMAVEVMTW